MHAALASVIRSPSTFSVMSSQRQPQNVQVASSTILKSAFVSSGLTVLIASASPRTGSLSTLSSDLLQHHVQPLAQGDAGAVRLAPHQPAREVAIGDEQEARGQLIA